MAGQAGFGLAQGVRGVVAGEEIFCLVLCSVRSGVLRTVQYPGFMHTRFFFLMYRIA